MSPYLKQQQVGYDQIILIIIKKNTSLGVALCLPSWFLGDSTTQGGEGKGAINIWNFYNKNKHNNHWLSSCCCQFLSPFPLPQNTSSHPPPPPPTAFIVSIVTPELYPPWRNKIRPSQNPTQSPLLFNGLWQSKTKYFLSQKQLAHLTWYGVYAHTGFQKRSPLYSIRNTRRSRQKDGSNWWLVVGRSK